MKLKKITNILLISLSLVSCSSNLEKKDFIKEVDLTHLIDFDYFSKLNVFSDDINITYEDINSRPSLNKMLTN